MKYEKISKKKIWQTLSAKVVHKNPWYRIVQEKFVLPAQRVGSYFIIEPHGTGKSVMIVAAVGLTIVCSLSNSIVMCKNSGRWSFPWVAGRRVKQHARRRSEN